MQSLAERVTAVDHMVDDAQCMQALWAYTFTQQQQFTHQLTGEGLCQVPAAATIRGQCDAAVSHDKNTVTSGHYHVAGQGEREACTRCGPLHGGNHRFWKSPYRFNPVVKTFNALGLNLGRELAIGFEALQITTRAKVSPFTGDDHTANVGIGLCDAQRFDASGINFRGHRVAIGGI